MAGKHNTWDIDWDGDGRKDLTDAWIEYQVYKEATGNSGRTSPYYSRPKKTVEDLIPPVPENINRAKYEAFEDLIRREKNASIIASLVLIMIAIAVTVLLVTACAPDPGTYQKNYAAGPLMFIGMFFILIVIITMFSKDAAYDKRLDEAREALERAEKQA